MTDAAPKTKPRSRQSKRDRLRWQEWHSDKKTAEAFKRLRECTDEHLVAPRFTPPPL